MISGLRGSKWAEVLPWLSGTAFLYFHIRLLVYFVRAMKVVYLHFDIEITSI